MFYLMQVEMKLPLLSQTVGFHPNQISAEVVNCPELLMQFCTQICVLYNISRDVNLVVVVVVVVTVSL